MKAEAIERMKLFDFEGGDIREYQESGQITVTDQQFLDFDADTRGSEKVVPSFPNLASVNGRIYKVFTATPNDERLQLVKEIEKESGVLVYHIIRVETSKDNDNNNDAIYAFLTVWGDDVDWEYERKSVIDGMPYGYYTIIGYPHTVDMLEYGNIPVEPYLGCLVVTNVRL
jgi:hypothetical protein